MPITSDRNQYIGAHVTRATKEAMRQEAERLGMSVSAYVAQAIERKLAEDAAAVAVPEDVEEGFYAMPPLAETTGLIPEETAAK